MYDHHQKLAASPPSNSLKPLFDERSLASHLNVSVKAVQAWRYKGGGPAFVRLGRAIRYRPNDVEAWLTSNTFETTTDADVERPQ